MKRFYSQAGIRRGTRGFAILLDDRPVQTPARASLEVPAENLARAISEEWNAQSERIDPRSMPLTGLANAAIDRVVPDPKSFASGLAVFGESDLLCYRAEGPAPLVRRQSSLWDPILAWARRRFDVDLEITSGILHRAQPDATISRLASAVHSRGAFELAGISPLVTLSGSLLIALALADGELLLEQAWEAAIVDERWQAQQWGEDSEALKALDSRRRDFEAAARFLALL